MFYNEYDVMNFYCNAGTFHYGIYMPAGKLHFIMPCFNIIKHCIIHVQSGVCISNHTLKKNICVDGVGVIKFLLYNQIY